MKSKSSQDRLKPKRAQGLPAASKNRQAVRDHRRHSQISPGIDFGNLSGPVPANIALGNSYKNKYDTKYLYQTPDFVTSILESTENPSSSSSLQPAFLFGDMVPITWGGVGDMRLAGCWILGWSAVLKTHKTIRKA